MDKDSFLTTVLRNPANAVIARALDDLALPDAWIVSGCLVQTAWNGLTGRTVDYGINDYDVFYFDPDTSWAAEDTVIRRLAARPSLVSGQAQPALSAAAALDRGHRSLPDAQYHGWTPSHAGWL
jgi:hypothetical protein